MVLAATDPPASLVVAMSGLRYVDLAPIYLERRWDPLPLPDRRKSKVPVGFTGADGKAVTRQDIARWVDTFPMYDRQTKTVLAVPSVNLAVRVPRTVVGIDVDDYGAKTGADALVELIDRLGELPATWTSTSRGDGPSRIHFYRIPEGVTFPGEVPGASIEFIQHGHRYAVVYPSIHPEGRPYRWYTPAGIETDDVPAIDELADLPAAWVAAFGRDASASSDADDAAGTIFDDAGINERLVAEGGNRLTAPSYAKPGPVPASGGPSKAVMAAVGTFHSSASNGRHPAMRNAVMALTRLKSQGHPGADDALDGIRAAFINMVTTGTENRRSGEEAETEWADAVAGAQAKLGAEPDKRPHWDELTSDTTTTSDKTTIVDGFIEPVGYSDAFVSEAFGATLEGRWLYAKQLTGWVRWDGARWQVDPGEAVYEEFRRWIIELGDRLWKRNDAKLAQAARYRDKGKIDAAVVIARRLRTIEARAAEFDQHPHLLNAQNGVVNLRTGDVMPHDPALRLTKIAGAKYVPGARHPDIDAVLEALADDVRPWVQRLFGAAASGEVLDDVLAVFDGTGSNGKTTLLKAAASALGEYATPASTRLLMARAVTDEHPTLIADLLGRRLVFIEETPEGGALKMEQVKSITGGGALKARFIGGNYFHFEPTHSLIVATNHRPAVNASDHAAWRRLRLVPFTRTYRLPHEAGPGDLIADRGLRARLTQPAQRTAMLAWIVEGAVAWYAEGGLGPCPTVDAASSAWRRDEDIIHAWWHDAIYEGGTVGGADLYRSHVAWCEAEGRRYVSSNKEFVKRLTDHELYKKHRIVRRDTRSGVVYEGLSVVDVEGSSPGPRERLFREPTPPPSTSTTTRGNAIEAGF